MEGHDIDSSPVLDDTGTLYIGTMARTGGAVIALEGATGELK